MPNDKPTNYFDCLVYITGTIGGIACGIVALFVIFANSEAQLIVCGYIVGALCAMGLGLGLLAARHAPATPHHAREGRTSRCP